MMIFHKATCPLSQWDLPVVASVPWESTSILNFKNKNHYSSYSKLNINVLYDLRQTMNFLHLFQEPVESRNGNFSSICHRK